ncbi:MAG: NAD(P)/FAD-dependent oxidoreductase [Dehalococcoidia bacterium]|nr:NAD(P)/FAD-dependent oxidoreductase [Dehalococcoidia bacterium]
MPGQYDVIVIGTGPNGLEIGAYLSKAGLKVLMLEKRYEAGGGLATEQVTLPDFFHNTHAVYHMMVDYAPVYSDFKLEEQYGVRHIHPELQWAMPLDNGKCICIYRDVDKTCASIAQFSQKDADSYRKMYHQFHELVDSFVAPATFCPPVPAPLQAAKLDLTEVGRQITAFSEQTPEEVVNSLFENDHVRTLMLYICCHWGLDYNQSGVGYLIPLYLNRATSYRLTAGGSHRVSNALLKSIFEHKGQIRTSAQVTRILTENGAAKGVELEDGTQIMAGKAVVSTIDTHQTFLKYVGEDKLDRDFVDMIKIWHWEKWSLCDLHLALNEPPRFRAAETNPDVNRAFVYLLGYERLSDLLDHWESMRTGGLPAGAGFNCCFPSIHDPYQAPPGKASGLLSQMAPFTLDGSGPNKWLKNSFRQECAERMAAILERYAPNMTKDNILWTYLTTPADIENKFANMVQGSYKQGAYHPLQMGYLRPNQDCSLNRTPVKNLYLGGCSVYPGGCVIWGPGYNCANSIAEDLGIEKWWSEPSIVTAAREKGLID